MKGWSLADLRAKGLILDEDRARPMLGGRPAPIAERPHPFTIVAQAPATFPTAKPSNRRGPNKWEAAYYDERIRPEIAAGRVTWCEYEGIRLRIGLPGSACWYTPDWPMVRDGRLEVVEVKGFMREAARVRLCAIVRVMPWLPVTVATGGPGKWRMRDWRVRA